MWHVWVRGRVHTGFWWGNLIEKRSLVRLRRKWEDNTRIIMDVTEIDWRPWAGLTCRGMGTSGGLL
jgi:hypothetical protein